MKKKEETKIEIVYESSGRYTAARLLIYRDASAPPAGTLRASRLYVSAAVG